MPANMRCVDGDERITQAQAEAAKGAAAAIGHQHFVGKARIAPPDSCRPVQVEPDSGRNRVLQARRKGAIQKPVCHLAQQVRVTK